MHSPFLAPDQAIAPLAIDYQHGDSEPAHSHSCSQLIHTLCGVVEVHTALGTWMVPPGRGIWLPAYVEHSLRFIGGVKARTLFVDPLARADLPAQCQVVQISPPVICPVAVTNALWNYCSMNCVCYRRCRCIYLSQKSPNF